MNLTEIPRYLCILLRKFVLLLPDVDTWFKININIFNLGIEEYRKSSNTATIKDIKLSLESHDSLLSIEISPLYHNSSLSLDLHALVTRYIFSETSLSKPLCPRTLAHTTILSYFKLQNLGGWKNQAWQSHRTIDSFLDHAGRKFPSNFWGFLSPQ